MQVLGKLYFSLLIGSVIASCGGGAPTVESDAPSFFVGQMSTESSQAPVGQEYLATWLISYIPGQQEIYLSTTLPSNPVAGRDRWALTVRFDPARASGTLEASTLALTLFSGYKNECCINREDPFGSTETYASVFTAVAGTVSFVNDREGTFDVEMQQETSPRSGDYFGNRFRLTGCWRISRGETGASGCQIAK